jgi:HAD superfamily hydrolase (TIGR01509 family)
VVPEADYARFLYGRRTREILVDYFKISDAEANRLIAGGLDDKTELVAREGGLTEIPGAADFVRASKAMGFRVAVATSASAPNVRLALHALGLAGELDAIVTSADVEHGKPAPDPYIEAARRLGVSPHEAVVFEDMPVGIASAHSAGARCVAVATTLTRDQLQDAELVIDDFRGIDPGRLIRDLGA